MRIHGHVPADRIMAQEKHRKTLWKNITILPVALLIICFPFCGQRGCVSGVFCAAVQIFHGVKTINYGQLWENHQLWTTLGKTSLMDNSGKNINYGQLWEKHQLIMEEKSLAFSQ